MHIQNIFFVFLALLLAGCAQQNESANSDLRVMTYNIRYDNPDDGVNRWDNRRERVANLILFHAPDMIGLQEAIVHQVEWLDARLPGYEWIGVGRTDGKKMGEFAPIFYNSSRLKLLEHDTFWLSETPGEPSQGWDAALPRIVTWARFRERSTGLEFYQFNTHFDHRGVEARRESARLIVRKVEELAGPGAAVVVSGDFNVTPDSPPYQVLSEAFRDGFTESELPHYGPEATYLDENGGFSVSSGNGGRRIDYLFAHGKLEILRHGILPAFRDGRFPSDHLPVLMDIRLNP